MPRRRTRPGPSTRPSRPERNICRPACVKAVRLSCRSHSPAGRRQSEVWQVYPEQFGSSNLLAFAQQALAVAFFRFAPIVDVEAVLILEVQSHAATVPLCPHGMFFPGCFILYGLAKAGGDFRHGPGFPDFAGARPKSVPPLASVHEPPAFLLAAVSLDRVDFFIPEHEVQFAFAARVEVSRPSSDSVA